MPVSPLSPAYGWEYRAAHSSMAMCWNGGNQLATVSDQLLLPYARSEEVEHLLNLCVRL